MDKRNIEELIGKVAKTAMGQWADFGSADGDLTLEFYRMAQPKIELYSIDRDLAKLETQKQKFKKEFPDAPVHFIYGDFLEFMELPLLDGVIMINSLHFIKEKERFLKHLKSYLEPDCRLLIAEYDTLTPNAYVPYPVNFENLQKLALSSGYPKPEMLAAIPSRFYGSIYSAEMVFEH